MDWNGWSVKYNHIVDFVVVVVVCSVAAATTSHFSSESIGPQSSTQSQVSVRYPCRGTAELEKYLVSSASLRINRVQKVSWITRPHWIKCICVPLSKGCFTLRVFCKQDHQSEVETYPIVTDDDEADKKGELEPLKVTLDTVGKLYLLPFDTNDQSVCVRVLCSQTASSIVIDRHSKISCLLIS